jgi:hypothetical protein
MGTMGDLKAEYRVARTQVLALVERMNEILAEAGRDFRLHLKPERIEIEDDADPDDADPDAPRANIGRESAEREDEAESLPADDGDA